MKYTFSYGLFHWLVHYVVVSLLIWVSGFHLINITIPITIFGYTLQSNIADLLIAYVLTTFVDWDHILVYKKYGRKGILRFAQSRITYPLHNFFFLGIFGILSAFTAILFSKIIAILFLVPVVHMLWDMFEDVFIFRATYRKWEKTWGIGSKDLEELWKELEKIEKSLVETKGTS